MIQKRVIPALFSLVVGCNFAQAPVDPTTSVMTGEQSDQGPGSEAWAKEDISCDQNSDCLTGESCLNDVCQPTQCEGGLVESAAPIGASFTFFADNEIGVADSTLYDGAYWVDTFAPSATSAAFASSTELSSSRLLDLSGGRFEKVQNARYVTAVEGRNAVGFSSSTGTEWTSLTFQPLALDAGDTDADGLDEVVAVSADGLISICNMDSYTCDSWQFAETEGLNLIDVGVGDVDGDAIAEIALILDLDDQRLLYVLNQDWEEREQLASYQLLLDDASRIDVGDLDGDRVAEVIVLRDVNEIPLWGETDAIDVYQITESVTDPENGDLQRIAGINTAELEDVQDLDVADTSADSESEIYAIDSNGKLISFDMDAGVLYERFTKTLDGSGTPHRIALTDIDGDSPQASLVDGPTLARGAPVPATLVMMPPYDADHSSAPSSAAYGSSESTSTSYQDTVSLGMNIDLGVGIDFMELFGASYSTSVRWRVSQTTGERFRITVGERFGMSADPDLYGPYHGAVSLYWGCFDTYTYEISDPNGLINDSDGMDMDSETFVLTVPVGGSTSIWSLSRYNALAEAIGDLPVLDIPYAVGTVEDYPETPERLDGTEIPEEDMLFDEVKWYLAPDVGGVSYRASIGEEEFQRESWNTSMGAGADIKVAGVKVGMGAEYGWGQGYSIGVGSGAFFSGSVKAVPDDPNTPEDEYEMYAFRFAPVVYRHWYENPSGEESALYVMTYAAKR